MQISEYKFDLLRPAMTTATPIGLLQVIDSHGLGRRSIATVADQVVLCFAPVYRTSAAQTVEEAEAAARRMVACWNACHGITTEGLEAQSMRPAAYNETAALRDALNGLLTIFDEFDAANGCRWEDARREAALVVMAGAEA